MWNAGYKKENVDIDINEDGTQISVSGAKEVEEMHMIPFKKELKIKGFRKKFRIPDEVNLDGIKAKYNEDEADLRIVMPKMVRGICGVGIEEVKEEEVADRVRPEPEPEPEPQQSVPEKVPDKTVEETPPPPVKKKRPRKPWKPCPPLFLGGSTLLVSLIFLVIHYIRVRKS